MKMKVLTGFWKTEVGEYLALLKMIEGDSHSRTWGSLPALGQDLSRIPFRVPSEVLVRPRLAVGRWGRLRRNSEAAKKFRLRVETHFGPAGGRSAIRNAQRT